MNHGSQQFLAGACFAPYQYGRFQLGSPRRCVHYVQQSARAPDDVFKAIFPIDCAAEIADLVPELSILQGSVDR